MTKVQSLLLGTAAGLIAVAGAQAADMPVKAKPVQYVKICTLYGDGYYYIPGTDTCIKIGGYVRTEYGWNTTGARNPQYFGTSGAQDRTVASYSTRHRANVQIDTRQNTAYGTLRTLESIQFQNEDNTFSFNVARAFIQWAGFTFGHAVSFADGFNINDSWHYMASQNSQDTGANGVNQIAYTFEFGNGVTLTFGADERRTKAVTNLSRADALAVGREPSNSYAGENWPDPHVDLRIDQAWGFFQVSGIAHDVRATYYTDNTTPCPQPGGFGPSGAVVTTCGHPADAVGWAVNAGGELKLPWIAQGDRIGAGFRYAQGASGYGGGNILNSADLFGSGNNVAVGWITDAVYLNGTNLELTTTWTVMAGYEHYWTPALKTSITGGYTQVLYDATAKSYFVSNVCTLNAQTGITDGTLLTNCNPDWSFFQGGIRTQWSPSPGFFMGIDTTWTQIWTAFNGTTARLASTNTSATTGAVTPLNPVVGARPAGIYNINNQGIFSTMFRAQRNFNTLD